VLYNLLVNKHGGGGLSSPKTQTRPLPNPHIKEGIHKSLHISSTWCCLVYSALMLNLWYTCNGDGYMINVWCLHDTGVYLLMYFPLGYL